MTNLAPPQILRISAAASYSATVVDREATEAADFVGPEPVKGRLEVVEDDRVCQAFEDEAEFPERIQAVGIGGFEGVGDGADVED